MGFRGKGARSMKWYSMTQVAGELGVCLNTFKKYYLEKYPPDQEFGVQKKYTASTLLRMKKEILKEGA